jgi:hypothetical protein
VHRRHLVITVAAVTVLAVGFALPKLTCEAPQPPGRTTSLGFAAPYGVAFHGGDTFVSNENGNSIIEFHTASGKLVRVLRARTYGFDTPNALAISGDDGFVVNLGANTVTEFNVSTGSLVRVIGGRSYGFDGPRALTISGVDALVSNGNSITEFDTTTGALVRKLDAQQLGVGPRPIDLSGFASSGDDAFVEDDANDTVIDVDAVTGKVVRVIDDGFGSPGAITISGVTPSSRTSTPTRSPSSTPPLGH